VAFAGKRQDAAKRLVVEWSDCVEAGVRKYAKSSEPSVVVIDAAQGRCVSQAAAFRASLVNATRDSFGIGEPAPDADIQRSYDLIEKSLRQKMTTLLLDLRAE
jgi:hypothetical protein